MAKRPTKLRRQPTDKEFVVWRGRNGKIRKYRSDVLLIGEVRSRKTGKTVGFLNSADKKSKKPTPRKFSSMQRALLTVKKGERPVKPKSEGVFDMKFKVYTSKLIRDQIPNVVIDRINERISIDGEVVVAVEISLPKSGVFHVGSGIFLNRKMTRTQLAMMITIEVVQGARAIQLRTSPKKYQTSDKGKNRKQPRVIIVEVKFLSLG